MKKLITLLLILTMVTIPNRAYAATAIKITYDGKTINYIDKKLKVIYNDTKINIDKTPGILIQNNALLPYEDVFEKSKIKATSSYNKKTKKITMTYRKTKIQMTVNKKTAYINGEKLIMPIAPKQVKYEKSGKTKILVPSRFVAENLGLEYSWYSKTGTIVIKEKGILFEHEYSIEDESNTIKFLKDETILGDEIVFQDDYKNRQFIIILKGNYLDYYQLNQPIIEDSSRVLISVTLDEDGNTRLCIKTNIIRGFVVNQTDELIQITIKRPKDIYQNIVVLDAGHGGLQPGTLGSSYGNELVEKEITLDLVNKAKEYFDADSQVKVYFTRLDDRTMSLADRPKIANEVEADLFLSIHINAFLEDLSIRGTQVYYSSLFNQENLSRITASAFSEMVLNHINDAVGSENRGIFKERFQVIDEATMPAVLLEVAYLSNENDVKILEEEENRPKIGKAIYDAVKETFELSK